MEINLATILTGVQEAWEAVLIQESVVLFPQRRAEGLTHTDLVMVMSWAHVRWGFEEGPARQG